MSLPVVIELLVDVGTDIGVLLLYLLVGDRILAALVGIARAWIFAFCVDIVVVQATTGPKLQPVCCVDREVDNRTHGGFSLAVVVLIKAPPQATARNRAIGITIGCAGQSAMRALVEMLIVVDIVLAREGARGKILTDVHLSVARLRLHIVDAEVERDAAADLL